MTGTTSRRPRSVGRWVELALAVVLVLVTVYGFFLAYIVAVPAVVLAVVSVISAARAPRGMRAVPICAAVLAAFAGAVSTAFLAAGSIPIG